MAPGLCSLSSASKRKQLFFKPNLFLCSVSNGDEEPMQLLSFSRSGIFTGPFKDFHSVSHCQHTFECILQKQLNIT
jgi:hypothetical protein